MEVIESSVGAALLFMWLPVGVWDLVPVEWLVLLALVLLSLASAWLVVLLSGKVMVCEDGGAVLSCGP